VVQQGEKDGEMLRKNDDGVSTVGGDGGWQRFIAGRKKNDGHQWVFFPYFKTNSSMFSYLPRLPPFQFLYMPF
jgi:hypothetical protein